MNRNYISDLYLMPNIKAYCKRWLALAFLASAPHHGAAATGPACAQLFQVHSGNHEAQKAHSPSTANPRNPIVTELAQLTVDIYAAMTAGHLDQAAVLRNDLKNKYHEAINNEINLGSYSTLLQQFSDSGNNGGHMRAQEQTQKEKILTDVKESEHALLPWITILEFKSQNKGRRSVVFSPDRSHIVMTSDDYTTKTWSATTGDLSSTLNRHTEWINSAIFSADGSHQITVSRIGPLVLHSSSDGTAKIWNAVTGNLIATLKGHTTWINSAAFSPDGSRIVTTSKDNTAKIWKVTTGDLIADLTGHSDWVLSAAFSPDGSRIVTAAKDNTAKIWNGTTGELITTLTGHASWISSVAYSADASRIITTSKDHSAKIWNATTGELITTLKGHTEWVRSASFSAISSNIALTVSSDRTAKIWNTITGDLISTLMGQINSAVFSPDGARIVTDSDDGLLRIWAPVELNSN
jgi:WD40 repeat protein